jgi:hypothetical protein
VHARVYDIANDATSRVANRAGMDQYSAAVTADGTVYLARAGFDCGANVELVRDPLGSTTPAEVYAVPHNHDTFERMSVLDGPSGRDAGGSPSRTGPGRFAAGVRPSRQP